MGVRQRESASTWRAKNVLDVGGMVTPGYSYSLSLSRELKLLGRQGYLAAEKSFYIIHERSICSTGRVRCTAKVDGLVSCHSDFT